MWGLSKTSCKRTIYQRDGEYKHGRGQRTRFSAHTPFKFQWGNRRRNRWRRKFCHSVGGHDEVARGCGGGRGAAAQALPPSVPRVSAMREVCTGDATTRV